MKQANWWKRTSERCEDLCVLKWRPFDFSFAEDFHLYAVHNELNFPRQILLMLKPGGNTDWKSARLRARRVQPSPGWKDDQWYVQVSWISGVIVPVSFFYDMYRYHGYFFMICTSIMDIFYDFCRHRGYPFVKCICIILKGPKSAT